MHQAIRSKYPEDGNGVGEADSEVLAADDTVEMLWNVSLTLQQH